MTNKTIAALVLGFLVVSILLSLLGIIDIRAEDVLGYAIIILGLSLVYPAYRSNQKLIIFVGSGIFLTGIAIIIFSSFELNAGAKFITPLLLIITGISLLVVYLSEISKKIFLIISVIALTSGTVMIYYQKPSGIAHIISSVYPVIEVVWPVFLILVVIIILTRNRD